MDRTCPRCGLTQFMSLDGEIIPCTCEEHFNPTSTDFDKSRSNLKDSLLAEVASEQKSQAMQIYDERLRPLIKEAMLGGRDFAFVDLEQMISLSLVEYEIPNTDYSGRTFRELTGTVLLQQVEDLLNPEEYSCDYYASWYIQDGLEKGDIALHCQGGSGLLNPFFDNWDDILIFTDENYNISNKNRWVNSFRQRGNDWQDITYDIGINREGRDAVAWPRTSIRVFSLMERTYSRYNIHFTPNNGGSFYLNSRDSYYAFDKFLMKISWDD